MTARNKHIENLDRVRKISLEEQRSHTILNIEREKRSLMQDLENIHIRSGSLNCKNECKPHRWDTNGSSQKRGKLTLERSKSFSPSIMRHYFREALPSPTIVIDHDKPFDSTKLPQHLTDVGIVRQSSITSPKGQRRAVAMMRKAEQLEVDIRKRNSIDSYYMYGSVVVNSDAPKRWQNVKMHKYHQAIRKPALVSSSVSTIANREKQDLS